LIDLEVHQLGGLGHKVRLGVDKPGAARLLLVVVAKDDQASSAVVGGSGGPLGNRGLCGSRFGADRSGRSGFLLRHDRSPEKPKGPGEGALLAELMDEVSNRRRPTGWFLTRHLAYSAQYYPIASVTAADTRIIAKTAAKSSLSSMASY
jgi:hypothetical protein